MKNLSNSLILLAVAACCFGCGNNQQDSAKDAKDTNAVKMAPPYRATKFPKTGGTRVASILVIHRATMASIPAMTHMAIV
ncbi:MAG: hypothetical protein Q8932_07635, partial [Bacteroidota bacterium]|nr:hypothetical protein [Bacteroidota bacterium]